MISSQDTAPERDARETDAARMIQRNYRGHQTRRELRGFGLNPSTRWVEAVKDMQYQTATAPRENALRKPTDHPASPTDGASPTPARQNWQRITRVARHAGSDDSSSMSSMQSDTELTPEQRQERRLKRRAREKTAKMMDIQYFLEMVDHKHRYGSNLRQYHNYWKTQDTAQNFFYWLDLGEGKDFELPTCSRARLEKEQVRYLSREERLSYLVNVDAEGRLVWAKSGERVTTNGERFRDSVKGIVATDDPTPTFQKNVLGPDDEVSDSDESGLTSDDDSDDESAESAAEEADRYVNYDLKETKGPKKLTKVSPAVIFNHLMRQSLKKKDKWIFLADTSFRLYIGIKDSGHFQHSSFLKGARITAAGLIKVKDGQLRDLSPLSGHYRPPVANFRAFIHHLRETNLDMSRVSISKSYAVLVGIESYKHSTKKAKDVNAKIKDGAEKVLHPEQAQRKAEAERDKSKSAAMERAAEEKKAALLAEEKERQREADKGKLRLGAKRRSTGFGRKLKSLISIRSKGVQDSDVPKHASDTPGLGRGIPGTGPEDGFPAPEGKR